jgi:hypothetical protein
MKKLFFLLVVVNLVIWLWGQREQLGRVAETTEPGVGVIRLLDEAEVAARREQARQPAPVAEPVASGAGTAEQRQAGPARVDGATAPEPQPAVAADAATPLAAGDAAARDRAQTTPERAPAVPADSSVAASGHVEMPAAHEAAAATDAELSASTSPLPASGAEPAATLAPTGLAAEGVAQPPAERPPPVQPPDGLGSTASVPAAALAAEVSVEPPARPAEPPAAAEPAPPLLPLEVSPDAGPGIAAVSPREAVEESLPADRAAPQPPAEPEARVRIAERAAASGAAVPRPAEPRGGPSSQAPLAVPGEAAQPTLPARKVTYVCESIGPFADRAAALRALGGIVAPLRAATLREERPSRQTRHWVLAPVQPSKEATSEYLTRLGRAGVRDPWRIPNGPLAGRLAVGVFQSFENASKHADMLAAKGVAAEVHAPKDVEPNRVYWVDYQRPDDVAPPNVGGGRSQPALRIVGRSCGRVAGP